VNCLNHAIYLAKSGTGNLILGFAAKNILIKNIKSWTPQDIRQDKLKFDNILSYELLRWSEHTLCNLYMMLDENQRAILKRGYFDRVMCGLERTEKQLNEFKEWNSSFATAQRTEFIIKKPFLEVVR
jgi:hypothetical protein